MGCWGVRREPFEFYHDNGYRFGYLKQVSTCLRSKVTGSLLHKVVHDLVVLIVSNVQLHSQMIHHGRKHWFYTVFVTEVNLQKKKGERFQNLDLRWPENL